MDRKELDQTAVVKDYLTTAADGKQYNVTFADFILKKSIKFFKESESIK
jgi:hypothetical protein